MHFKSLLHVRDHSKATGRAHHLLEYIAQHVNRHTGEAWDLSVERLAYRLAVTPQWVRQLRTRLVETGELLVRQSRGRHCNVYVIPWERCPACQGGTPTAPLPGDPIRGRSNPQVGSPDENNPDDPTRNATRNADPVNPQLLTPPTRNSAGPNPKLKVPFAAALARIESRKEFSKEEKEKKEGATRNCLEMWEDKPERRSPFWCKAHGFCHSEWLEDEMADCWLTR